MVEAYRQLAARGDWPLHLGVTEAGPAFQGTIKSSVAFGTLLSQGIGDTIRVSLSAPPVEEVKVGTKILESLNLRPRKLDIVSCPSCGRAQVNVWELAENVTKGLEHMKVPLRVAVMGCVVNGPGEAREADLGVASGNGKGQIFVKGKLLKPFPKIRSWKPFLKRQPVLLPRWKPRGVRARRRPRCYRQIVRLYLVRSVEYKRDESEISKRLAFNGRGALSCDTFKTAIALSLDRIESVLKSFSPHPPPGGGSRSARCRCPRRASLCGYAGEPLRY